MVKSPDNPAGTGGSGLVPLAGAGQSRMELNYLTPGGGPFSTGKVLLFDTTMRGYDRRQVEQRVEELLGQLEAERQRADAGEEQAAAAAAQLAERAAEGRHGFGERVEKMLRLAERESAEVRETATEDAAAILEQARIQAEAHKREVVQSLAAQETEVAQRSEQLRTSLQAHQAAITSELAAARKEAAEIRTAAERDAALIVEHAQAQARGVRAAAERSVIEDHERARSEIGRLVGTRDGVCAELARLQELLAGVLDAVRRDPAPASSGAPPVADVLPLRSSKTGIGG